MSDELSKKSKKTILETKLEKVQYGWADTVHGLPVKELEANLLTYAKHRETVKASMEDNAEIKTAKATLKELQEPFNDTLKAINLKSTYIALLIDEKTGASAEAADEPADESSES